MSLRELPSRPNLEHLKKQARTLMQQCVSGEMQAIRRFSSAGITAQKPKLADALYVIAREYGFLTWPELKLHIELNSEDAVEALTAAIRANDAKSVREVLTRHASLRDRINEPLPNYGFDAPAIIAAVNQDNREIVDALLDAGANINERTRWWAGSFGVLDSANPDLAEYLISRGATVDIHAAARLGKIDTVRELLRANPDLVHARGGDGQLPLHFAATVEIASLLLDSGADINARDIDHESTAAQYMTATRQLMQWREPYRHDIVRFLIARGAQTDIIMASAIGDLALVEKILNDNPETTRTTINERYFPMQNPKAGGTIYQFGFGYGRSPHAVAHQFGHKAVFDLLMQRSAPWLRFALATEIGDEALAQQVLQQHPTLIARLSPRAARRIIGIALRNNTRAVAFLLSAGWPANATMDNNQTALHCAAWHGNLEMVNALIAHNAPLNIYETEHGGNPLAWALHGSLHSWERNKGNYPAVAQALLRAGVEVPKPEGPLEATEEILAIIHKHAN